MKSEPVTRTRAPDNQFRKMEDQLKYIRNTFTKYLGLWLGVPIPSVSKCCTVRVHRFGFMGAMCMSQETVWCSTESDISTGIGIGRGLGLGLGNRWW